MNRTRTLTPLLAAVATSLLLTACTGASATGNAADGDKAGGDRAPVTLRIGTDDSPGRPGADQIDQFAQQVAQRSDGQLTIEPVWQAAGSIVDDWDQAVARMVIDGDVDMGLIPARAWDTEGVTTLRALHAPFLVTTDDVVAQIVTGDLADDMLAGLDTVGVTGLALLPEGLRHLFVFGDPPTSLTDLGGKVVRAPTSDTTYATFEALGGTPDDLGNDDVAFQKGIDDGSVIGAESSFELAPNLQAQSSAIGDVAYFPKVNSLVVNTDVFNDLTANQQRILQDAARATVDWAIEHTPSNVDLAEQFCARGGRVVSAGTDRDELRQAVQSVYDQLLTDEATAAMIDQIEALMSDADMAAVPLCDGSPADAETTGTPGQDTFPEGVYRMEISEEELSAAGAPEGDAANEAGVYTLTIADGRFVLATRFHLASRNQEGLADCEGTYTTSGTSVSFVNENCGGEPFFTARWTAAPEGLRFEDVSSDIAFAGPVIEATFGTKPWTKVG